MPITRSGIVTLEPIAVTDREEVFDARIVPDEQTASNFLKISFLISSRSIAASITISQEEKCSYDVWH